MAASDAKAQQKSFDYVFKLLVVGDSSVGKTCLLFRYCENSFSATFIATIGIDFKIKTLTLDGKTVKLQIWDTAGQERFRTITTAYYRGAMGILFVYDVTSSQSFTNLKAWFETVDAHANSDVVRLILGNKCDVAREREVSLEEANAFARQLAIRVYEVSAKTGENVDTAFTWIAREIKLKADQKAGKADQQSHSSANNSQQQQQKQNTQNSQPLKINLNDKNSSTSGKCPC